MPSNTADTSASTTVKGALAHLIYSPKGDIEGALVDAETGPVQLVIDHDDDDTGAVLRHVTPGQKLSARVAPQKPSGKAGGAQPAYALQALLTVDGKKPAAKATEPTGYRGRVVRLNYARHGAANGVVLDTGDFIHLKPDGMADLKLKVGDEVHAEGDAQRLVDDRGWAVEAVEVNGQAVKARKPR